jgi:hypothetical protein
MQGTPDNAHLSNEQLIEHMLSTYFYLRLMLAVIGIGLPIVLVSFSWTAGQDIEGSMSAYYHSDLTGILGISARDVFVGALFAVAALLAAYKGYGKKEERAFALAALFAFFVAVLPKGVTLHLPMTLAFFGCVAWAAIFYKRNTLNRPESKLSEGTKKIFRWVYRTTAILMVAGPIAALATYAINPQSVFWAEALAIWAFGLYWLAKTVEMSMSHMAERILHLQMTEGPMPSHDTAGAASTGSIGS